MCGAIGAGNVGWLECGNLNQRILNGMDMREMRRPASNPLDQKAGSIFRRTGSIIGMPQLRLERGKLCEQITFRQPEARVATLSKRRPRGSLSYLNQANCCQRLKKLKRAAPRVVQPDHRIMESHRRSLQTPQHHRTGAFSFGRYKD